MAHTPRKRFGQNFLTDAQIINQIIHCIGLTKDQHWVEIGPGQGALTQHLLSHVQALDVVELDRDLVALLRRKFQNCPNLHIHSGDALKFDFNRLCTDKQALHIIGNLPYNISTPLLFHLLEYADIISDMYFMLQKEVVDRLCAHPGNKSYGRLSVMMQYFCAAEALFDVPPESFYPVPKVTSAIIRLTPYTRRPLQADDFKDLHTIVTQAFSQRRKTLRNSLKTLLSPNEISALDIDPGLRAESVSLQEFIQLSNFFSQKKTPA